MTEQGKHVRHFRLPRKLVDRHAYLVEQCCDKRVLHVGCVDYVRTGDWRRVLDSDSWLHGKIRRVAAEAVGIDIAKDAVAELRDHFGMRDIHYGDAEDLGALHVGTFDVIVAGEVIEHLRSPGRFLESAFPLLRPHGSLLVTTTNAFCARKFIQVLCGRESIHEDHVAYYSHRTLQCLIEAYNYRVTEQCSYRIRNARPLLPYLAELFARILSPNLVEGIICRATRDV